MKQAMEASGESIDWRREYEETLAAIQGGDSGCGGDDDRSAGNTGEAGGEAHVMAAPVERFLDRVLLAAEEKQAGEQPTPVGAELDTTATTAGEALALRRRLAAIGRVLRPLFGKQELAVAAAAKAKAKPQHSARKSARIGLLQLELVVRAIGYGGVKGKRAKKTARNEIRGLLDRVALLLDAANPASIAGDDGLSPFQELLEGVLAPRLEKPLPQLVRYLLKAYEFLDDEPSAGPASDDAAGLSAMSSTAVTIATSVKGDGSSVGVSPATDSAKQSILSALMEERTKKRSRDEVGDQFKEMQLPQELQQLRRKQHRAQNGDKARRGSSESSTTPTSKRHKSSHGRSGTSASSKSSTSSGTNTAPGAAINFSTGAPSVRRAISLDVALRSAGTRTLPTRRSLPSNSSFAAHSLLSAKSSLGSPPLLQSQAGRLISSVGQLSQAAVPFQPQPSRPIASTSTAGVATHRPVDPSRRAVVMRTPDRPRRQPARTLASSTSSSATARVLVVASPPLRRPHAGAQQQPRQQNAQQLLGGSSTARRPLARAPPPPLFK